MAWAVHAGQAVPREIAQVGIHGVGMHVEEWGDPGSGQVGGMEEEHLGATTLPGK
jgi:hypothetical protein